jgi:high-affinity iron transporter
MVLASFLVTSRETLEAALVVFIVLAYLNKTNNHKHKKTVYYGIVSGILASVIAAVIFTLFSGGFSGRAEEIFEGITMLIASVLLTTMILWMMRQKHISKKIEDKVMTEVEKSELEKTFAYGLFFLILIAILREGLETVIFLNAIRYTSGINFIGGILGVIVAIGIGYLFFNRARKINLGKFFRISSILLILFASGLVAHGIHELQEAAIVPTVIEHVWNTNFILDENGIVGSFMKGLFGYNGNPSLIEVLSYVSYLGIIFYLYRRVENSNKVSS